MGENKSKEARTRATMRKMRKILGEIDENRAEFVESLIENAAFMRETLRDLRKEIDENGVTEEYKNGANQYGMKKSPAVETYNQMIKNYGMICKQVVDIAGRPGTQGELDDGFDEFVGRR